MSSVTNTQNKTVEDYSVIYKPKKVVQVIKKDGSNEEFNVQKVIIAIEKSAYRALTKFTDEEKQRMCKIVIDKVDELGYTEVPISIMHNIVESVLEDIKPIVAKSYRDYRNYKQDFVHMLDEVYKKSQSIMYIGDKENSNTDSALVSTKRSLIFNQLNKELYQKFFMTTEEIQACREGYIYAHDMSARRDTMNCFARETKFITDRGVKSFMDYEDGDKIRVPSHLGIMRKAVVRNYGYQQLQINVFELKNGLNNSIIKTKEVVSTPNHRWLLNDGSETTNLEVGDELVDMPEIIEGNIMPDPSINRSWQVKEIKPYLTFAPEEVWCLEVEEDHSFLLEGGIPTGNCCLFDMENVLKGGFEMGNIWYNEPKTLDTAFDVIGDVTLSAASQQYGGFTIPEVDRILEPYAEKSYKKYLEKYARMKVDPEIAEAEALADVKRDFEQGFQGWEYKFNTVGSSRGDYPFITISGGLGRSRFAKMASIAMLDVRRKGQGKKENKKPVLFPKIVFLYDENLHGPGKELEDVFNAGIACSMKTMYPDWLSLTGEGYVPSIYKKYGKVISPMGCVDGQEIVTYKFNGHLYVEAFVRMWNRMAENFEVKQQPAGPEHLYMDLTDVEIYDKEKKGFVRTDRIIRNTSSKWVDLHLSNGRRLLCTTDHPITTAAGVTKHACELTKEDQIIINSEQYSEENVTFEADKAWLLGFILCDGCYKDSIFASIALESENDIEEKFHEVFPKYFNMETKTIVQMRGVKGNYKDLKAYGDGKGLTSKIKNYFKTKFGGIGKKDRQIPNEVFEWTRNAKFAFMAGMIDADGYFNPASHGGTVVQLGSTNKELALQQMALAQTLGMPAKVYYNRYNKKKPDAIRYRVEFFATEELTEYMISQKKKNYFKERSAYNANAESGDKNDIADVISVETVTKTDYSYDVTTKSAHFDVSGIWSHNCRAFLSPWYEIGGMYPADDNDKPVFIGRFNIGAVSLHLPMILAKARQESRDFYDVLDYYLNLIRQLHIRTYAYLSEMRASTNPLAYCEGGFLGGHLGLHDKIKPLLKAATASFGITALNELQMLYNGMSLVEDGQFALEVMEYINKEVNRFKEEDGNLYALYGTPAENLCFDADTMVQCYGGNKRIADIKVGDLVYSFNEEKHKVELKPVTMSKMTRRNAEVVKITFDNEQQIICTPDHPIGVRVTDRDEKGQFTGERLEYVKAKDLVKGMRIKSNYMYINAQGRWECSIYHNKKHQLVQDINAEYAYGEKPDGHVTHHKDEVKTNNEFSNLEYMADKAHRIHHLPLTIESHQYTREDVLGEKNPFYGKHHTDEAKQKNRNAHIGKSICALSENGSIVKEFDCADDAEKAGFTRHAVVMACRGKSYFNDHKYKKMHWYYKNECPAIAEANHKVESVEYLTETRDVYDITVEDNHNFFVGDNDGILVHNCGLQVKQFRAKYGIVEGVSDREYVSNSFHCHVSENITPIEKQDLEYRFWNFFNGGKIQYVKYPIDYNVQAVKTLVRRAMDMGFYEGVNMSLAYCDDCGHQELEMDVCPKCGSRNLTKIDRMNGYLSYSRVHGDTRLNAAKMAEIAERKSM